MEHQIVSFGRYERYKNYYVQGGILKSRQLYLHTKHSIDGFNNVLAALPMNAREQFAGTIYIGDWYSLSLLAMVDDTIINILVLDDQTCEELGVFSADLHIGATYRHLVNQGVEPFLELTPILHKTYHKFGEGRYLKIGQNKAQIQFLYPTPPPNLYCKSSVGYFRRAIELCGAQPILVSKTHCQDKGNTHCEILLEWQHKQVI